jgi:PAP2 superfamily C-terminal
MSKLFSEIKNSWTATWQMSDFRQKLKISVLSVVLILSFLPFFFDWIEARHGTQLHDWVLDKIPPRDMSLGVFGLLWGWGLWAIWRSLRNPYIILHYFAGYAILALIRIITITAFPLEPPLGLIVLQDPISNQFYGDKFITKDLFFSGHTSGLLLIGLCLYGKIEKWLVYVSGVFIGLFLMMLHVHYTIDIVVAPFGAYLSYWLAKKILNSSPSQSR